MLKLKIPKSFLRFANTMTVGELKNINPTDITEYSLEWTSSVEADFKEDVDSLSDINKILLENCVAVYGYSSKQFKYMTRNFEIGESVAHTHYSKFPHPETIREWVNSSKTGAYEDSCMPFHGFKRKEDS